MKDKAPEDAKAYHIRLVVLLRRIILYALKLFDAELEEMNTD